MIRTGRQYLDSLRDEREIWIDGERVGDVTLDPRFRPVAESIAELYDMQHDPPGRRSSPTSLRMASVPVCHI